jgi:hypothetical protein
MEKMRFLDALISNGTKVSTNKVLVHTGKCINGSLPMVGSRHHTVDSNAILVGQVS